MATGHSKAGLPDSQKGGNRYPPPPTQCVAHAHPSEPGIKTFTGPTWSWHGLNSRGVQRAGTMAQEAKPKRQSQIGRAEKAEPERQSQVGRAKEAEQRGQIQKGRAK